MKNFVSILLLFVLLWFPISAQEGEDLGEFREMVLKRIPAQTSILQVEDGQYVKALMVGATDFEPSFADWALLDFASEYFSGDVWNMIVVVANYSNNPVKVNIEFELRWNDGGKKIYRRWGGRTIDEGTIMLYMTPITNQIKELGLFTLYGRVSGLGIGNHNEVVTQIYMY
jgi:hypothetical protein